MDICEISDQCVSLSRSKNIVWIRCTWVLYMMFLKITLIGLTEDTTGIIRGITWTAMNSVCVCLDKHVCVCVQFNPTPHLLSSRPLNLVLQRRKLNVPLAHSANGTWMKHPLHHNNKSELQLCFSLKWTLLRSLVSQPPRLMWAKTLPVKWGLMKKTLQLRQMAPSTPQKKNVEVIWFDVQHGESER